MSTVAKPKFTCDTIQVKMKRKVFKKTIVKPNPHFFVELHIDRDWDRNGKLNWELPDEVKRKHIILKGV